MTRQFISVLLLTLTAILFIGVQGEIRGAGTTRDVPNAYDGSLLTNLSPNGAMANLYLNASVTNNGTILTNGLNILISPDNPFNGGALAVFTNAFEAILIGANNDANNTGTIMGNGIHIGAPGGVGSNSISIGQGSTASGLDSDGNYSSYGAIAIGNSVECSGIASLAIGNSDSTFVSAGDYFTYFIGEHDCDLGGGPVLTNTFYIGHNAENVVLDSDTFYLGSGPLRYTSNFVFVGGAPITGNGLNLTNLNLRMTTNAIPSLVLSADKAYYTNIASNITLDNFAHVPATTTWSIWLMVTNSSARDFRITSPNGVRGSYAGTSLGVPAAYTVTNRQSALIQFCGYAQLNTNMLVFPNF